MISGVSPRAREFLEMLLAAWRSGDKNGLAVDLKVGSAPSYHAHPDVLALRELELVGLVHLTEDEDMVGCWTLGVDLSETGIALAERAGGGPEP